MTTIRVAKRRRFTTVDRSAINDTSLSFRTRGILVWLLDKPDNWLTSADRIQAQGTEGREAIAASLKEMETAGYLIRNRRRDKLGKWVVDWTVYERPPTANRTRLAVAGEPSTETRTVSTEDGEPNTEIGDASQKSDPACVQCGGGGTIPMVGGGLIAWDRPCDCTRPPLVWNDPDPYDASEAR